MGIYGLYKFSIGARNVIRRKEVSEMTWVIIIGCAVTFGLYCCVRAGAVADRKMEKFRRKEKQDADSDSG